MTLLGFFGDRIFGPTRRELLEEDLRALEGKADRQSQSRIPSLRRAIEPIEARQARQVRNLELDDDPDGLLFRRIRNRLEELEQDRLAKVEELRRLEEEEEPGRREAQAVELLEALPVLPKGLSSAPEERLRRMFECFRLSRRTWRMGGQNPSVVLADADLDRAATTIAYAAMGYAGQKCTATSRVIVEGMAFDDFRDRLVTAVEGLDVVDPARESCLVGPLIEEGARAAALEAVERAGGQVLTGGEALDTGFTWRPRW